MAEADAQTRDFAPQESQDLDELKEHESSSSDDSDTASLYDGDQYGGGYENTYERRQSSIVARTRRQSSFYKKRESVIASIRSRKPTEPFTHKLAYTPTASDVIVEFEGPEDPYKAINWPFKKKFITTTLYGLTTMGTTFASSVYSPAIPYIAKEFHVSKEVASLGISLLLVGYGVGPLVWAPLSEVYGRKHAVQGPYFIAAIFAFAAATAKDFQTLMISRFFAGFFGSAPVTNTGGVMGDMWSPAQRGAAIAGYSLAIVGGPTLGPVVGSACVTSYLGWRWTQYVTGIMQFLFLALDVILCDESYPNKLLLFKARRLRHETGNWALHARHEEWDVSITELAKKYLVRPFQLLCTPICFLMSLYAAFVYSLLYASLGAFPIEFEEERGWKPVVASLPFLGMLMGCVGGALANVANNTYYVKRFKENNGKAVPEARLPVMMFGSVIYCGGLFFFAWTSSKHIHWICPVFATFFIGLGYMTIFQACNNYIVDTFQQYAASGIAANTFLRSNTASAFPLFITPMLHNMGINWGMSVFGFFSALLIPIPFMFFTFGKRIRAAGYWSRASL